MINITLNATFQDGKITTDINDLLKLIQQHKITEVEYEIEPKPMAFILRGDLTEYMKNNPFATCKGVPTKELVEFIIENRGKYCFLKDADLRDADLRGANFSFAKLGFANFSFANLGFANFSFANLKDVDLRYSDLRYSDLRYSDLRGADLRGADLRGVYLRGAHYNDNTKFPAGFKIPNTMMKGN